MPLIKEAKYLRILTPKTKKGTIVQHDEFGRIAYKETHVRANKVSLRAFEHENNSRPKNLRHIIELVDNPDHVPNKYPSRRDKARSANPRPQNEKQLAPVIDLEALKEQVKKEMIEEQERAERLKKDARNAADRKRKAEEQKDGVKGPDGPSDPGLVGDPGALFPQDQTEQNDKA